MSFQHMIGHRIRCNTGSGSDYHLTVPTCWTHVGTDRWTGPTWQLAASSYPQRQLQSIQTEPPVIMSRTESPTPEPDLVPPRQDAETGSGFSAFLPSELKRAGPVLLLVAPSWTGPQSPAETRSSSSRNFPGTGSRHVVRKRFKVDCTGPSVRTQTGPWAHWTEQCLCDVCFYLFIDLSVHVYKKHRMKLTRKQQLKQQAKRS